MYIVDNYIAAIQRLRSATEEICADRERGASALALVAARAIADATRPKVATPRECSMTLLAPELYTLASARPSMAAITNTVAAIWNQAVTSNMQEDRVNVTALHDTAVLMIRRWQEAPARIFDAVVPALNGTLLTFSRSGTVEWVLQRLLALQPGRRAVVLLSHPGNEGAALARSLAGCGWQITLIADAAASVQMEHVAAVVIGADTIRADGALVNKVGTYPLALVAREFQVPVYVLAETMKIAPSDAPTRLEEMPGEQILPQPVVNIAVQNVYFDLTPARLITAIYTEDGLTTSQTIRERAERAHQAIRRLAEAATARD